MKQLIVTLMMLSNSLLAQEIYHVEVNRQPLPPRDGHLKLGTHLSNDGRSLYANSQYFIKDGKPWYPVMGEFHFSRYPREHWEESILKMKAAGIDVIATYIFWIHHEEVAGRYNWEDNNDLRLFVELCKKHNVFLFVRVGPWCHGEVRNGGLPDWIMAQGNTRKNDPLYLAAVKKWYEAIAGQLDGLYFKDGGPIIGAQIENEYRFNNAAGLKHMLTLKEMAVAAGVDVPYYTATGWPKSDLVQTELIPVWGGYPAAPWDKRTTMLPLSANYLFNALRNDPTIGADLLGPRNGDTTNYQEYQYPYATVEMGAGIQITYHRRPIIAPKDVMALAYTKVGSGANLLGYYMFHGGSNAIGQNTTLQESRATQYPNDYPIVSYDFQAPIGEYGQLRPSYKWYKLLHNFLNDFGDSLVKYSPYFPEELPAAPGDSTKLRFSVRSNGKHGFVFISNYQRYLPLAAHSNVDFKINKSDGDEISIFEQPLNIPSCLLAILPFNMNLSGANLQSATLQPFCKLDNDRQPAYVFFQPEGLMGQYVLDSKNIKAVSATQATVTRKNGKYIIGDMNPGLSCVAHVSLRNGGTVDLITLSQQQALNSTTGNLFGKKRIVITANNALFDGGNLVLQNVGTSGKDVWVYPRVDEIRDGNGTLVKLKRDDVFSSFTSSLNGVDKQIEIAAVEDITPYQNKGALLPADDRVSLVNKECLGPLYQTNLTGVDSANHWHFNVPPAKKNVLLTLKYSGDVAAAYIDGKLVADSYYNGLDWQIALPPSEKKRDVLIQVLPFSADRKVYLEANVDSSLRTTPAAVLYSVTMQEYREAVFTE